jgi:hypothetical protein
MNKPKIECIFLDLDGVIFDFEKRYKELYHMEPREAENNKKFNSFFDHFIETNQFSTLELLPGAMLGIEFLRKLNVPTQILSSTANQERYDAISKQKMIALQTHDITFNPIFVPGKQHKYEYATPNRIIIDDTKSVINDWNKAGGIGIQHFDWPATITILKMYL